MSEPAPTAGRHCMVVHAYYPFDPRVEREARMLRRAGFEVDVICLRAEGERQHEVVDGVRVHRLPVARHRGTGTSWQMLEYLAFFVLAAGTLTLRHAKRRYGVAQLHNLPDFLVFAGLVPRLLGARLLLDLHDLTPEFYASRFQRGMDAWPVRLVRLQERLSTRFADHVITVTETWRQALIDRGVDPRRVDVVMNVADASVFTPAADRPRGGPTLTLIYHGTVAQRYGLDVVIEAIARIRDTVPVRLLIHGFGEHLAEIRSLCTRLGVDDLVEFSTRTLPTVGLADLIRSADVGVVPYRSDVFTDGILPTKLMEYAAVGVPAIASRTPAIAEYFGADMVRFVRPGSVEDMAEAITELQRDPATRDRLANAIRRFAREHSFDEEARRYVELVRRLHSRG